MLASGNPFINAYVQSDWFGKGIFWGLFALSALSWALLIHKAWIYYQVRKASDEFIELFSERDPLALQFTKAGVGPHPFFEMYKALKGKTLQLISKNHFFAPGVEALTDADLGLIESQVQITLAKQNKLMENNLFLLSTIASLGPFLGLLGTVWGILFTFSELRGGMNNSAMLSGLSLALATTVVGLVIAIPALVGFNYLKNAAKEYRRDMEGFAQMLLASIELQYRKSDYAQKNAPVP